MRTGRIYIALLCFLAGSLVTFAFTRPHREGHDEAHHSPEAAAAEESHQTHGSEEAGHEAHGEQVMLYQIGSVVDGTIELADIAERPLAQEIAASGKVVPNPNRVAQVGPLVSGRVSKLLASEGTRVRKGQVLAVVESTDVARAQAAYRQAQARVKAADARLVGVKRLAGAGVFSGKPVDEVRRERAQVASELAALRVANESEIAAAEGAVKVAEAVHQRVESARRLAQAELGRRRSLVDAGAVHYKPLEDARNEMAEAKAALITAQSGLRSAESTRARTRKLMELGTASRREVEAAEAVHAETEAVLEHARSRMEIAEQALARERKVFDSRTHVTREIETAESTLAQAEREAQEKAAELQQARRRLEIARSPGKAAAVREMENRLAALDAMLRRESDVSRQNLRGQAEVQGADHEVAQARAEVQAAADALRVFKVSAAPGASVGVSVVAPIDGVVTERSVRLGETVDATTALFTLMDLGSVWVDLDVYEKDAAKVRLGQSVRLTSQAAPGAERAGRVLQIGSVLDEKKRTVRVRTEVSPAGFLKPNMFVTAQIITGTGKPVLTVPREAIADEGGGKAVYIQWPDDKGWERHAVDVVATDSRYAHIVGPAAGEKVATKGLALVQAAVKAKMAGGGGAAAPHGHEH